mmetsp:Transcript_37479/g.43069  ORF Transcript_37479/g.43069 Transcript_37479/m.43069 type:complete len:174 (-) Transcript_37479:61-582(-)
MPNSNQSTNPEAGSTSWPRHFRVSSQKRWLNKGQVEHGNKWVYTGGTTENLKYKQGVGILVDSHGSLYEGYFEYDRRAFLGRQTDPSGEVYEGEWRGNKKHGFGVFEYTNNDKYVGCFAENFKHGIGTYIWANGDRLVANWRFDKADGKAKMLYSTGTTQTRLYDNGNLNLHF